MYTFKHTHVELARTVYIHHIWPCIYLVISLPKIPYINLIYMVLANPTHTHTSTHTHAHTLTHTYTHTHTHTLSACGQRPMTPSYGIAAREARARAFEQVSLQGGNSPSRSKPQSNSGEQSVCVSGCMSVRVGGWGLAQLSECVYVCACVWVYVCVSVHVGGWGFV
jgi:hypothetical protein